MNCHLGEEGTEQFTIETRVDGKTIRVQPIHDPFIFSKSVTTTSRWGHFISIFKNRPVTIEIIVRASEGAQRAIMTLDPVKLQQETDAILEERREIRERNSRGDYSQDICSTLDDEVRPA
jgi:hypothetical protein